MIRTQAQNRKLHGLLGSLNISAEVKEDLVYQFSNGRTLSSCDLTIEECEALNNFLKTQEIRKNPNTIKYSDISNREDRMRKKCISICHEMGWKLPSGKIDMARVNDFCEKRGHGHKKLNQYKFKELPLLITQFERVLKEYYAKG